LVSHTLPLAFIHVNFVDVAVDRDVVTLAHPFFILTGAARDGPHGAVFDVFEVDGHSAPALGVLHSGVAGVHFFDNALIRIPLHFLLFSSSIVDPANDRSLEAG